MSAIMCGFFQIHVTLHGKANWFYRFEMHLSERIEKKVTNRSIQAHNLKNHFFYLHEGVGPKSVDFLFRSAHRTTYSNVLRKKSNHFYMQNSTLLRIPFGDARSAYLQNKVRLSHRDHQRADGSRENQKTASHNLQNDDGDSPVLAAASYPPCSGATF